MKTLLRAALLGSALAGAALAPAMAQVVAPAPGVVMVQQGSTLNLSAYGEAKVAPDMATISTGVVTEAPTAAEAMRLNRERMAGVIAALQRQGIAERDIQTSGLNLNPVYTYRENQPPLLRGYQANNQVTVIVYDLGRLGQAVDAVVASGANQVNGIGFGLRDPQKAEDAARLEAVKRLNAKAQLYSGALGKRIRGIRSFSEGGGYAPPPPMPVYARAEMAADASTPVAPGQLTLRVDVTAVFELEE